MLPIYLNLRSGLLYMLRNIPSPNLNQLNQQNRDNNLKFTFITLQSTLKIRSHYLIENLKVFQRDKTKKCLSVTLIATDNHISHIQFVYIYNTGYYCFFANNICMQICQIASSF